MEAIDTDHEIFGTLRRPEKHIFLKNNIIKILLYSNETLWQILKEIFKELSETLEGGPRGLEGHSPSPNFLILKTLLHLNRTLSPNLKATSKIFLYSNETLWQILKANSKELSEI